MTSLKGMGGVSSHAAELKYAPHIDGLRALAILSVLLFHLDRRLLPGGFVGVDVFFVLSGYLITRVILADSARSGFSALKFYQRRIARIFPAFAVVIAATYAAAMLLYTGMDKASAGANGMAAAISLINMKLIFQGSYFQISEDAQPLLHYWSLAVEEQFYVFYPLLLVLAFRWMRRPAILIGLALVASFALAVGVTAIRPEVAFYALPTRAWELLAGALLAIWHVRHAQGPSRHSDWLAAGGAVGLLASFVLLGPDSHFPGPAAALPVAATAALLEGARAPAGYAQRLLSWRPLVAIGLVSYSLYLWHWPIFSFVDYSLFTEPAALRTALKAGLTAFLAIGSYFVVERPARRFLNQPRHQILAFAVFVIGAAALAGGGYLMRERNYLDASADEIGKGGLSVVSGFDRTVLLIGDSKASMYGRQLSLLAREQGLNLRVASMANGNVLPDESDTMWPHVARLVTAERPQVVVLAYAWGNKVADHPDRVRRAVDALTASGARVVLVQEPPVLPEGLSREAIREGLRPPFVESEQKRIIREKGAAVIRALAGPKVVVVDVAPLFEAGDAIRFTDEAGRQLFQDMTHLSDFGAGLAVKAIAPTVVAPTPVRAP